MESKSFKKKKVSFTEILDKNESESEDWSGWCWYHSLWSGVDMNVDAWMISISSTDGIDIIHWMMDDIYIIHSISIFPQFSHMVEYTMVDDMYHIHPL